MKIHLNSKIPRSGYLMTPPKNISILGSTGSVGTQALEVIRASRGRLKVTSLAAGENIDLLEKQIREFEPGKAYVKKLSDREKLKRKYKDLNVCDDIEEVAADKEAQVVLSAISGRNAIPATLESLRLGKTVALAQKEVLVEEGEEVRKICKQSGAQIIPVDSEHSAIFQSIGREKSSSIEEIILTCSGGPFFRKKRKDLKNITPEQALAHPKWNMGKKISIDSATLMNKALELIEAVFLFNVPAEKIRVLIHPEAKIHSGVVFQDGNVIFTAGATDMKIPIAYALYFPERVKNNFPRIDFSRLQSWNFYPPDEETFPSLKLARKALEMGGKSCADLNQTNDKAVELFLEKEISFLEIFEMLNFK